MDKQAELDALAAEIVEAGVCSELAAQATQLVMGDGNADADIVFIGEAPGKNEDLQGKPCGGEIPRRDAGGSWFAALRRLYY